MLFQSVEIFAINLGEMRPVRHVKSSWAAVVRVAAKGPSARVILTRGHVRNPSRVVTSERRELPSSF